MDNGVVKIMFVNVVKCPRCGDHQHENLKFQSFMRAHIAAPDGTLFTHYAMCPIVNEPILLRFDSYKENTWVLD